VKGRLLFIARAALAVFGLSRLATAATVSPPAPEIPTVASVAYPEVTCTSSDDQGCTATLQLASDVREQLTPLLQLGKEWRFPVHIHILTPDDPLTAKVNREAAAVFADHDTMKIEAVLPANDPDARIFLQEQFVTALLWEKFFASTKTFDTNTPLDRVPVWLIVGLSESLNDDAEHDRESIVRKAVQTQRSPTLFEVTNWHQVSRNRLMGLWQRSFCYYLVASLTKAGQRRSDFQQWLATLSGPTPSSAQYLFPTEMGWQRELVDATQRSRDLVYTWDETVSELASTEVITIPGDKPSDAHVATFDTIMGFPRDKKLVAALQAKLNDLTALELRAHASWRPILAAYRFGLTDLINDANSTEARVMLKRASELRVAEMANHQKLVDYANWFEVTKDLSGNESHFRSYFSTAQEVERVEADPAHPNPFRADLLMIESQL